MAQLKKNASDALSSIAVALAEVAKVSTQSQRLMCGEIRVAEMRREFLVAVTENNKKRLEDCVWLSAP